MAAKMSRRGRAAIARSGASVSPSPKPAGKGFLERVGQSRFGRKVIAPALTTLSLASQLQAEQNRDVNRGRDAARAQGTSKQPIRGRAVTGSKLNPLPPGMNVGARLDAERQRERQSSNTGELADMGSDSDRVMLELPTRSYARPEATDTEKEMSRQQEMMRTARSFLAPSGEPIARSGTGEERGSSENFPEETEEANEEEAEALEEETIEEEADEEEAAQQLAEQQYLDELQQAENEQIQAQENERQGNAMNIKRLQKMWRTLDGVEVAASETIFPLVLLVIQLNMQVINEFFFRVRVIPPTSFPEKVACCCLDGIVCMALFGSCFAYLFPLIVVLWALNNPWDAVSELMKATFGGGLF